MVAVVVAAVVLAGAMFAWREARTAAALPAKAAAATAVTFEPTDATIGPNGATTVLGTLTSARGATLDGYTAEITDTGRPGCELAHVSLALAPRTAASATVALTLSEDAPMECAGARITWRVARN